MIVIILNDNGSVHHISTDGLGAYPCFAINERHEEASMCRIGVHTTSYEAMRKLHLKFIETGATEVQP